MVTRYVSPSGNDSNAGDGPADADAWLTITNAMTDMGSETDGAHILWIAPGVYREAMNIALSGTSGNIFEIRGDPNCIQSWASTVKPGRVRVTACNSSEVPQDSELVDFNGESYVTLFDLHLDGVQGTGSNYVVAGDTGDPTQHLVRCVCVGGQRTLYAVSADWCVAIGVMAANSCNAANGPKITNSLLVGANRANEASVTENCILLAGYDCFYGACTGLNCTVPSALSFTRTYVEGMEVSSSLGIASYSGFNSATSPWNDDHMGNLLVVANDFSGDDTVNWATNDNRYVYHDIALPTNPPNVGHAFQFPDAMTMIRGQVQTWKIDGFNDYDINDGSATALTEDIEGRTRDMRPEIETADVICSGACEIPDLSISDTAEIKILKKGEEILYVPVETGTSITIEVDIVTNSTSNYPKIELWEMTDSGWTLISGATDTATSGSETLSISGSPTSHDKVCILKLVTLDTTASSYTEFSGLAIS